MPPSGSRTPVTALRAALILLCAFLSAVAAARTYAALPLALLSALALAAERIPWLRTHPVTVGVVEAAIAGASIPLTGDADSPMLPYLLAAPMCVGLRAGVPQVLLVSLTAVAALLTARLTETGPHEVSQISAAAGQWLVLGLGLGLAANRARVLQDRREPEQLDRYVEVRALLQQLRAVSQRLPGSLDAASTAEGLLQACSERAPAAMRSAVLVQPSPGALVPIAVRGTKRVPWRAPLSEKGPLQQAWDTATAVVDRREPDHHGRRKGSALVAVPLCGESGPFGLVVLEAYNAEAFSADEVTAVAKCCFDAALQLESALLFEEVRSSVTVAERDRLAREMHDGVAQDLAYIGYSLDDLRNHAAKVDEELATKVSELRNTLTGLVSDLRLSITDLRTSVSSERGLGSALTSYVRAIGSSGRLAVHLSLDESAFRLPGDQEVLLLQVAQAVAQDARRTGTASNLWVELHVDPPAATLVVQHDGPSNAVEEISALGETFGRLSGILRVSPRPGSGIRVDAVLGGGADGSHGHAGR